MLLDILIAILRRMNQPIKLWVAVVAAIFACLMVYTYAPHQPAPAEYRVVSIDEKDMNAAANDGFVYKATILEGAEVLMERRR